MDKFFSTACLVGFLISAATGACAQQTKSQSHDDEGNFISALNNPDARVRRKAVLALGVLQDPRAVRPLLGLLQNNTESGEVKSAAIDALNGAYAVEPLIYAMNDADQNVRKGAAIALRNIDCWDEERHCKFKSAETDSLISLSHDPSDLVRAAVAGALGHMASPRAVNVLLQALKDRDLAMIAGAFVFYVKRGELGSEDALIEILNSSASDLSSTGGNFRMAEIFLNSGNPKLESAAMKWSKDNKIEVINRSAGSEQPVRWGGEH
jgi:HEAT repeat protein